MHETSEQQAGGSDATMRTSLWLLIIAAVTVVTFLLGYLTSGETGIEPGYFQAAETGGYGAGASGEAAGTEGMSEEMQKYYKELAK